VASISIATGKTPHLCYYLESPSYTVTSHSPIASPGVMGACGLIQITSALPPCGKNWKTKQRNSHRCLQKSETKL